MDQIQGICSLFGLTVVCPKHDIKTEHKRGMTLAVQELRNARKFVERQQLFEKKYMIGSKLGEQAGQGYFSLKCYIPISSKMANVAGP